MTPEFVVPIDRPQENSPTGGHLVEAERLLFNDLKDKIVGMTDFKNLKDKGRSGWKISMEIWSWTATLGRRLKMRSFEWLDPHQPKTQLCQEVAVCPWHIPYFLGLSPPWGKMRGVSQPCQAPRTTEMLKGYKERKE